MFRRASAGQNPEMLRGLRVLRAVARVSTVRRARHRRVRDRGCRWRHRHGVGVRSRGGRRRQQTFEDDSLRARVVAVATQSGPASRARRRLIRTGRALAAAVRRRPRLQQLPLEVHKAVLVAARAVPTEDGRGSAAHGGGGQARRAVIGAVGLQRRRAVRADASLHGALLRRHGNGRERRNGRRVRLALDDAAEVRLQVALAAARLRGALRRGRGVRGARGRRGAARRGEVAKRVLLRGRRRPARRRRDESRARCGE
mmetsp:Transcript_54101/g.166459  ORF Transcript_54101/g.166459 Transcript_54101/m.166459 type:complete len:257 (+) Transcript_54101:441-1211(+)